MGIDLETAAALIDQMPKRGLHGDALLLGKQDITFTFGELVAELGLTTFRSRQACLSRRQQDIVDEFKANGRMLTGKASLRPECLSDEFFFRFIGFDVVKSVDYSNYENADFIYDLNVLGLSELVGTYDLIWDCGTMEHIFHIPNLMANIHHTLKLDGTVIHTSPANGYVDHGFYQFSPTFFQDYYGANGYSDIHIAFGRNSGGFSLCRDYFPHMLNPVMDGGLDAATYFTICHAKRTIASSCDRVPQQRDFAGAWRAAATHDGPAA